MDRNKRITVLIIEWILILTFGSSSAWAQNHAQQSYKQNAYHNQPSAQATALPNNKYADIVIDAATGRVLHATNPDSLRHPASLAKMMTLYLTFQALKDGHLHLEQMLPVSAHATNQEPTKLGLQAGDNISVKDAILSLVTQSANDSAVVLAEALGGDEANFGRLMTQQANALGMKHSQFYNASGLPNPNQITTAADMAILGSVLIKNFPEFYNYFSQNAFTYGNVHYHNHNHLMGRYPGMDGIKTGYTASSGFNLVASAQRNGTRLIGVVFGGNTASARDQRMAELLNAGFTTVQQSTSAASSALPNTMQARATPIQQ
jgi:D-alanyl-D-alanine carboxypeptidase